jgi:hypothetical protein
MAYQNLDAGTIGAFQRMLGVPITMAWDPTTDQAMKTHLEGRGLPYGYGTAGDAKEWEFLTATLRENEANPNPALTDPAYQAYLRQSGVQQATIKDEILARIDTANRERNRAAAGFQMQKDTTTKNIATDFEGRGLYSSGVRQSQQADASGKIDFQMQQEDAARNDALTEANRRAEQQLAELGQRKAEEEIAARNRVGEKRAKGAYGQVA